MTFHSYYVDLESLKVSGEGQESAGAYPEIWLKGAWSGVVSSPPPSLTCSP